MFDNMDEVPFPLPGEILHVISGLQFCVFEQQNLRIVFIIVNNYFGTLSYIHNPRSSDSTSPFLFQRPQERVSERARCGRYIEVALPGDYGDGYGDNGDGIDDGDDIGEGGCDDVGDDGCDYNDSGGDYLLEPKAFEDPLNKPAHPVDFNQLRCSR